MRLISKNSYHKIPSSNSQDTKKRQIPIHNSQDTKMTNNQFSNKKYDLEERALEFSKQIVKLCKSLPKNVITIPLINQFIRSGTAIGANYIEANDALGKKDFVHRVKIARKEAKETIYWLKLVNETENKFEKEVDILLKECIELKNILSAIIRNSDK